MRRSFQQTICHASSPDGVVWTKDPDNPILSPMTDKYEPQDWRDPYVFYNDEDGMWWMIFLARLNDGPPMRRGCIVLYRSPDLKTWHHYGPLYQPYHTNGPECPEMYKMAGKWYLSYSRFSEWVNTVYRVSETPFGPWRTPKFDGIGGRRFYAAKSLVNSQGRRFYFGWAHDRADRSDNGEWYWGGAFCIPHEVKAAETGELEVKMPEETAAAFAVSATWNHLHQWGNVRRLGSNNFHIDSLETLSCGFFDVKETTFLFSCKVRPTATNDHFGFVLKADSDITHCLILMFERGMQRVSLVNMPQTLDPFWQQSTPSHIKPRDPGPDGPRVAEKPFLFSDGDEIDVKIAIDNDMVEIFVGERVAFTYRSYAKPEHEIGYLVQDAIVDYYDVQIKI